MRELDQIADELNKLQHEMSVVLQHTRRSWGTEDDLESRHFPYALYGFMMCLMSKVDYLAKHWIAQEPGREDQTKRVVEFLHEYLGYPKKASEVAVQFFRHSLMHTSTLDEISDNEGNRKPVKLKQSSAFELRVAWLLGLLGIRTVMLGEYEKIHVPGAEVDRGTVDLLAADADDKILLLVACTLNVPVRPAHVLRHSGRINSLSVSSQFFWKKNQAAAF